MAERQPPTPRGGERRQQPSSYRDSGERRPQSSSYRDGGERRQPPSSYRDGGERRSSSYQDGGAPRRQTASSGGGERRPSSYRDGGERRTAPSRPSGESQRRQSPSRRNDVIRCENCGEDYSVTYKRCPFCDERPSRGGGSGKRVANTRGGGYGRPASALKTATWIGSFVVVCIAMVIVYRFMGAPLFGGNKDPDSSRNSDASTSTTQPNTPPENPGGSSSGGSSANDPPNVPAPAVESISLSKTDFTLNPGEEQELIATLLPAGVTGDITWSSSNEAVAAVDASGKVTNVNTGATNTKVTITAACGDVTAVATVYCKPAGSGTAAGGSQGTVVNADKGVNIRSGPGTDYDKVASVSNGSKVTVLGEENGWYKVSYSRDKIGYIRKDYISVR